MSFHVIAYHSGALLPEWLTFHIVLFYSKWGESVPWGTLSRIYLLPPGMAGDWATADL